MTFSAFSPRISRAAFGLVVAAAALTTVGCPPDNHVGRPCELGTTPLGGSSGQIVTVSSPALECPSRMCLLAGAADRHPAGHRRALHRRLRIRRGLRRRPRPGRRTTHPTAAARTVSRACGRRRSAPSRARSCAFAATSSASPRVVSRSPRPAREHDCRSRQRRRARAPLDGDGRVTLDSYGRVGNMAPPFGLWQLIRSRRRGSREIPTGRTQGVPMTSRSPSPSISLAARTFGLLALALALFGLGGACEDKHVGRPCELGTVPLGGTSGQIAAVVVARAGVPEPHLPAARRREDRARRRRPRRASRARRDLHGRLRVERRLRGRRDGQREQRGRQALPRRVRLQLADDGRRLRLPEALRLHRLRQRSDPGGFKKPSRLRVVDRASLTPPTSRRRSGCERRRAAGRRPRTSPRRRRSESRPRAGVSASR